MAQTVRTTILVLALTTLSFLVGASTVSSTPESAVATQRSDGGVRIERVPDRPISQAWGSPSADEQALVDWAVDRFAQAGLDLPELAVSFDPTRKGCDNAEGLYRSEPGTMPVVVVCAPDADTFAAKLRARRTLLHEFAHAWDLAYLSDRDREELALILGVGSWYAEDAAWDQRGAERLAEAFVYALLDQPRRVLKVSLDCSALIRAFHTATGADPLGPGLPPCAA